MVTGFWEVEKLVENVLSFQEEVPSLRLSWAQRCGSYQTLSWELALARKMKMNEKKMKELVWREKKSEMSRSGKEVSSCHWSQRKWGEAKRKALVLGLVWADWKREVWKKLKKMIMVEKRKEEELVCVPKTTTMGEGCGWRQKGWS